MYLKFKTSSPAGQATAQHVQDKAEAWLRIEALAKTLEWVSWPVEAETDYWHRDICGFKAKPEYKKPPAGWKKGRNARIFAPRADNKEMQEALKALAYPSGTQLLEIFGVEQGRPFTYGLTRLYCPGIILHEPFVYFDVPAELIEKHGMPDGATEVLESEWLAASKYTGNEPDTAKVPD